MLSKEQHQTATGPVHSLDLAVRSGVLDLGESAFDLVLATDPVEDVLEGVNVAFGLGN